MRKYLTYIGFIGGLVIVVAGFAGVIFTMT